MHSERERRQSGSENKRVLTWRECAGTEIENGEDNGEKLRGKHRGGGGSVEEMGG